MYHICTTLEYCTCTCLKMYCICKSSFVRIIFVLHLCTCPPQLWRRGGHNMRSPPRLLIQHWSQETAINIENEWKKIFSTRSTVCKQLFVVAIKKNGKNLHRCCCLQKKIPHFFFLFKSVQIYMKMPGIFLVNDPQTATLKKSRWQDFFQHTFQTILGRKEINKVIIF